MRSGVQALSLLASPLNVQLLQALEEGPTPLPDLRRTVGHPPVTTMRSYLRNLADLSVVERHREDDFPGSVSYAIAGPGKRLLLVADILQRWLNSGEDGPVELGSIASKSIIKALVDGWSAGIIRALAARPLALTELDRLIPQVSYPALERRLTAMRQMGLVEPDPTSDGRVARCQVTQWLRFGVAPLTAAIGWECQCIPDRAPAPGRRGAEAMFLLAVPLLNLPSDVDGTCRLAVEFRRGADLEFAGAMVTVTEGEVCSCVSRIEGESDAWATGPILDWFRWLRGANSHRIEVGGDTSIAHAFEQGLRNAFIPVVSG